MSTSAEEIHLVLWWLSFFLAFTPRRARTIFSFTDAAVEQVPSIVIAMVVWSGRLILGPSLFSLNPLRRNDGHSALYASRHIRARVLDLLIHLRVVRDKRVSQMPFLEKFQMLAIMLLERCVEVECLVPKAERHWS